MPSPAPFAALGLAVFAATGLSCATSSLAGGLDSPLPAARLHAMQEIAAEGDRSPATVRRLIEQLDSDDAAVRLLAISTLERLTGQTHGYRPDAPAPLRREAIERWIQAEPPLTDVSDPGADGNG